MSCSDRRAVYAKSRKTARHWDIFSGTKPVMDAKKTWKRFSDTKVEWLANVPSSVPWNHSQSTVKSFGHEGIVGVQGMVAQRMR